MRNSCFEGAPWSTEIKVFVSGAKVPGSIRGTAQNIWVPSLLAPLLHLTCGAGGVDDKDLIVSSIMPLCLYTKSYVSR